MPKNSPLNLDRYAKGLARPARSVRCGLAGNGMREYMGDVLCRRSCYRLWGTLLESAGEEVDARGRLR